MGTDSLNYLARNRTVLAFVHIEKAAGTTFVDTLRRNICARFCEVRPLEKESGMVFTASDMRKILRINPFLVALAGHSVKPFSDLKEVYPNVQYIALLRDPLKRYVSHYQYWLERMEKTLEFSEFLKLPRMRNFQTQKISGSEDLEAAKEILRNKFLLIGLVEKFDEFVLMLKRVSPYYLDPRYRQINTAKSKAFSEEILGKYHVEIIENNQLDIKLYGYVKNELMPGQKSAYDGCLKIDLENFRNIELSQSIPVIRRYLYYAYKKLYFKPVTGIVRLFNGLPMGGVYGAIKKPG